MQNIRLTLQYDGTRYLGWSRPEKNGQHKSVSYKITEILKKLTGEDIVLFGGAKTDPGVHALAQTASFRTASAPSSPANPPFSAIEARLADTTKAASSGKADSYLFPLAQDAIIPTSHIIQQPAAHFFFIPFNIFSPFITVPNVTNSSNVQPPMRLFPYEAATCQDSPPETLLPPPVSLLPD